MSRKLTLIMAALVLGGMAHAQSRSGASDPNAAAGGQPGGGMGGTVVPAMAPIITKVERRNPIAASAGTLVQLAPGPLVEGALAYADRTHVFRNIPPALLGAQYIPTAQEDKNNPNLELHLTIGQPGTLYVILDNRVGTNLRTQTATPNPAAAGMIWMLQMGFVDTGMDITVDENANGSNDNYSSVFAIPVTPGEVVLRAQYDRFTGGPSDRNMYGVAATPIGLEATRPMPANGAQMVLLPMLTWTPGASAAFHNVYLGTTPQLGPADLVGFQLAVPIFHWTRDLVPGVTYYWRVDEIEADRTTMIQGDVWSFTTALATAYDPVPADGAAYLDRTLGSLTWKAGQGAVAHDLYFAKDRVAVDRGTRSAFGGTVFLTRWILPMLDPNTTYYWRVDEVAPDGVREPGFVWSFTTLPIIAVKDPNLVGWWKMDEGTGTTVVDWSGHGHHATFASPAPTWAKGRLGSALQFAGHGDSVVCASGSFVNGLEALTIAAWVKSNVTGTDKGFLTFEVPDGNDNVDIRYDADGFIGGGRNLVKMGITVSENGVPAILQLESSSNVQTTDWQHVTMVWSSGQSPKLYLDGTLDAHTVPNAVRTLTGTLTGFGRMTIGKGGKDIVDSSWEGLIDDLRLYDKALTEEQIQAVMQGRP
jgi:hypothetical protein